MCATGVFHCNLFLIAKITIEYTFLQWWGWHEGGYKNWCVSVGSTNRSVDSTLFWRGTSLSKKLTFSFEQSVVNLIVGWNEFSQTLRLNNQTLRPNRVCSDNSNFDKQSNELESCLLEKGYSEKVGRKQMWTF